MGATTVSVVNQYPSGGTLRLITGTITMSNSYATNGDTCAAASFGVNSVTLMVMDFHKSGLLFEYDYANGKMIARYPTGGATASPTSVSSVPQVSSGGSSATAVNAATPALTPGVGKEVGSTTDLSTIILHFVAYGL